MKLALAQMKMNSSMDENFQKSLAFVREAAALEADLIFFPEIQLTPFFPQYEGRDMGSAAIGMDSRYIREFCEACKDAGIYACPNFYIEEDGRHYDMNLLINDRGEIIGRQKMVHIAQCEMFYEQDYYTPSEEGFSVFDTPFGKIGIVVCFDRHYPESIRTEALRGADLILIPTANTADEPSELFRWEIRIQAFHNSVYTAMCNRVGKEDRMTFSGESVVTDPNGEVVALAGSSEELLIAEFDISEAAKVRARRPYTNLRRPELYE